MAVQCEHNSKLRLEGLCTKCKDVKPYMVFRMVHDTCPPDCKQCGYFWGPGFPDENLKGQRPYWATAKTEDKD